MRKFFVIASLIAISVMVLFFQISCAGEEGSKPLTKAEKIDRGKYLVGFGGCNDCHTPKVYTEMGPVPDTTRLLSGHPAGETLPAGDVSMTEPGKWVMTEKNFTAWVGPWGISYSANITPDNATGIGTLSEEMFIKTLREGKWMGVGRPLMPPMPWQGIGGSWPGIEGLSDEDLGCIYAYLMSLTPINNKVPDPVPPNKAAELLTGK